MNNIMRSRRLFNVVVVKEFKQLCETWRLSGWQELFLKPNHKILVVMTKTILVIQFKLGFGVWPLKEYR